MRFTNQNKYNQNKPNQLELVLCDEILGIFATFNYQAIPYDWLLTLVISKQQQAKIKIVFPETKKLLNQALKYLKKYSFIEINK